jgi:hypothetical protein
MPAGERHNRKNAPTPVVSDEVALVIYAALLATWMGCLLWSSLASNLPPVPRFLAWDKLQHFVAYAILIPVPRNFLKPLLNNRPQGWIIGFIHTRGFGLRMEFGHQTHSTSRHADGKDLVANALGAALIFAIALLCKEKKSLFY